MENRIKQTKTQIGEILDSIIGLTQKYKSKVNSVDESLPEEEAEALLLSYTLMLEAEARKYLEGE